jgi:glycosyltransferase involved in cell wall biosynthesis
MSGQNLPRLGFVGPFTGNTPGKVITQGEILAQSLGRGGYPVLVVSTRPNRLRRMLDITWTLWAQRDRIDIQVVQVFSGPSFVIADLASGLGRLLGKKQVFILHGGNLPVFARRHPGWVSRVLRRADRLVAPSQFLARELAWLGRSIQVVPNHIDLDQFPYRQRTQVQPRLFWMRNFHPLYNPRLAVRLVARLSREVPNVHLTMAGSGGHFMPEIRSFAESQGVAGQIAFAGFLDLAQKIRLADQHDIYLNTTHVDNMPVTVIEMGALGLPVVATRVGGVPDILQDEVNGLLVPDDDDLAMTDAVHRLISEPELAGQLSLAGRRLAEGCSWEKVEGQWGQLISEVWLG